ncbi:interleukin-3 receptor subunit alpha isoform X2 [Equus quagga]|uniref:interleukin-3 receptor subunit alpha isoform X2 n=1 Tax=Equus quagga TaxID=89248 RepID=UPI001EE25328|nr:interleukin-3 receptor subunit alpha isoform X2 [Equus quagga]
MSTPRISTSPGAGTPGGWFWKPEWDSDGREGLIKAEIPPGGNMHTGPKVDTAVGGWMRRRAAVQPHGGILRSREQERGPDTAARGRTLNPRRSETEAHTEGCTARDPVEGKRPEPANPTTESGFVDGDGERLLRTRPPPGPMALVWIVLFLTPASGLLLRDQDPSPPIRNVRMEPESQRLTWDLHGNVSGIKCSQSLEYNVTARKNQYCQFPVLPSCGSKNYTVFVTGGQPFSTSIGYPEPEGNPGAAAQNLTCWVHDVDFLTCRWAVGSAAPRDVQYHLHVGEARTSEGRECPGYTADERGTHVRCRFDDLSGFSNRLYRFRVRGTSRASGIPCSEMFEQLSRIGE